jgi:hypothetical protein
VRRGDLRSRQVAERGHDAADGPSRPAAMRRSGLGQHRAVVAQCRRLGALDVGDVLEPRVGQGAEGRASRGRGLCGSTGTMIRRAFRLDRPDELGNTAAGLELGQVAGGRAAGSRAPTALTVRCDPRGRAETTAKPLAVCAAPLDGPHGRSVRPERLDEKEGGRDRILGSRVAHQRGRAYRPNRRRTTGGPPADQLLTADQLADQFVLIRPCKAQFSHSRLRVLEPISAASSACHAEGRGFESLHPLVRKARVCGPFLFLWAGAGRGEQEIGRFGSAFGPLSAEGVLIER